MRCCGKGDENPDPTNQTPKLCSDLLPEADYLVILESSQQYYGKGRSKRPYDGGRVVQLPRQVRRGNIADTLVPVFIIRQSKHKK